MKMRNLFSFSFKTEAIWMTFSSFGFFFLGLLVLLIVMLVRYLQS
jgi:hypothetical protein